MRGAIPLSDRFFAPCVTRCVADLRPLLAGIGVIFVPRPLVLEDPHVGGLILRIVRAEKVVLSFSSLALTRAVCCLAVSSATERFPFFIERAVDLLYAVLS